MKRPDFDAANPQRRLPISLTRQHGVVRKTLLVALLLASTAVTSLLIGLSVGSAIATRGLTIAEAWQRMYSRVSQSDPPPVVFQSTFLTLNANRLRIPVSRPGYGGALTVIPEEGLLVLTHEGGIFFVGPDRTVQRTSLEVPDNGYAGLVRVSQLTAYSTYWFDLDYHRYNDILYVPSANEDALYVSYTEFFEDRHCYVASVARFPLPRGVISSATLVGSPTDWSVVYRTEPCLPLKNVQRAIEGHIAGGRMELDSDAGRIYLTVGDYTWDGVWGPEAIARRSDWHYGKVIEIELDTHEARVFSLGHRNPQGITRDLEGRLWTVENGPRGGDELNLTRRGQDYGWPDETLGTLYNALPWPNTKTFGRHAHFTAPVYAWLPSVAPSSLAVIDGFHETWHGDLLMTTMGAQSLFRLRIIDESLQFAERIFIGQRLRDVVQLNQEEIVLWTDQHQLLFLSPKSSGMEWVLAERVIASSEAETRVQLSARRALENCIRCHELTRGIHRNAPSLSSIYGERIGSTDFGQYSEALRAQQGRWDDQALRAYIASPSNFAPGTTMPETNISDEAVLGVIVDVLKTLRYPTE